MRLLRGLHNAGPEAGACVATIGNFDGVHLGHQAVLQRVQEQAVSRGVPALAVIFEPQPLEFFRGAQAPARLMTLREKVEALADTSLDYVCCLRFDASLSRYSADRFVDEVLAAHLGVKHLVIGDDFRYGGAREGDFAHLQARGALRGFTVESTPTYTGASTDDTGSARISSTRLRDVLAEGDFAAAASMMGRPYCMTGRVVHGQALGRKLGFPTANIPLRRKNAPLGGVYAVRVERANGECLNGVANIGCKPSVGQFEPNLEVHVLDFSAPLYGERLRVEFVAHIRQEQRFEGLDALKAQIKQDVAQARALL